MMAMRPQAPILDLFVGGGGDAYRLYFAPASSVPASLRRRLDERGDVFPVRKPDLEDLASFMWATDSPYAGHTTSNGAEIYTVGRSAVTLTVWLEGLVEMNGSHS